jgi:putative peptidoglycan lipid II flippase
LLRVESYKKGIVLSTLFNIVNKALVFVNSLVIAFYFGTQLKVDLYFYAYNTILLIVTFLSSLNSSVLIPESMAIRAKWDDVSAMRFFNFFIYGYFLITLVIALVFFINPVRIFSYLSHYDPVVLKGQSDILFLSIPLLVLITVTTLLTDILTSYKFFTVPMLAAFINAVFSLLFILVFHRTLDIKSILLGLIFSYSLNLILLIYLQKRYLKWDFRIIRVPLDKKIIGNMALAQLGNFASTAGSYAPLYFLSGFGTGIIAALNYAQQIATQPTSFITNQFTAVSRIKITELYVHLKFQEVNTVFITTIRFLIFILIPVSGLVFLFSDEIVTLLFKRGSFTQESVHNSALFLQYLGLSLPLTAIISIAGNLYVAAQLIRFSIAYQVFSNALMIALVYYGLQQIGAEGYPLAFFGINLLNVLVVYLFCKKFFPFIQYKKVISYLLKIVALNLCIMAVIKLLLSWQDNMSLYQKLALGCSLYVILLIPINRAFRINQDFHSLLAGVWNRVTKRPKS